jgi:hypothetical protein
LNQYKKQYNNNLRLEFERLQNENLLIKEALKAIKCEPCGGPHFQWKSMNISTTRSNEKMLRLNKR